MKFPQADIPIQKTRDGSLTGRLMGGYHRMRAGIITPLEFILISFDKGMGKIFKLNINFGDRLLARRMIKQLKTSGNAGPDYYRFKDAKIPVLSEKYAASFFHHSMPDVFYCYLNFNDNYDEKDINDLFYLLPEGPYSLVNERVDVRVNKEDIVIDAGSWIGDFAAYASAKGAVVYAFEPDDKNYDVLVKTAELNSGIRPVKKALGSSCGRVSISGNMGTANAHEDKEGAVEITTIDDFVRENNLERVDFIKCDIEGFERKLLAGAQETLARFAPKLALCTYHLPDDPEVMEALIKQANPKYNVVQKRKKLFASVPK